MTADDTALGLGDGSLVWRSSSISISKSRQVEDVIFLTVGWAGTTYIWCMYKEEVLVG